LPSTAKSCGKAPDQVGPNEPLELPSLTKMSMPAGRHVADEQKRVAEADKRRRIGIYSFIVGAGDDDLPGIM
jgi:hypothetical protein